MKASSQETSHSCMLTSYVKLLLISDVPSSHSPLTSTSPANEFVGIDQTITFGSARTTILPSTSGITDTGTTLLLIASGQ